MGKKVDLKTQIEKKRNEKINKLKFFSFIYIKIID